MTLNKIGGIGHTTHYSQFLLPQSDSNTQIRNSMQKNKTMKKRGKREEKGKGKGETEEKGGSEGDGEDEKLTFRRHFVQMSMEPFLSLVFLLVLLFVSMVLLTLRMVMMMVKTVMLLQQEIHAQSG